MLTPQFLLDIHRELVVDLFAGGGGASTGIELAIGRPVDVAINHDPEAVSLHEANHPQTKHFVSDVFAAAPRAVTGGRPVGLLWASPDCTFHSKARGGKPHRDRNQARLEAAAVVGVLRPGGRPLPAPRQGKRGRHRVGHARPAERRGPAVDSRQHGNEVRAVPPAGARPSRRDAGAHGQTTRGDVVSGAYEARLRSVLGVVQEYLPPDGIDAKQAMGKITGLVDPWPGAVRRDWGRPGYDTAAEAPLLSEQDRLDLTAVADYIEFDGSMSGEESARHVVLLRRIAAGVEGRKP